MLIKPKLTAWVFLLPKMTSLLPIVMVAIFTAIYQQLRQYIIQHDMSAYIAEKYPQLNLEPIHLLNNLLHEIALLEYPPKQ